MMPGSEDHQRQKGQIYQCQIQDDLRLKPDNQIAQHEADTASRQGSHAPSHAVIDLQTRLLQLKAESIDEGMHGGMQDDHAYISDGQRCGFFTDQEYRKYASRQKQSQYLDHSDAVQAGRPIRHMCDHRLQKDGQHTAHRDDRPDGRIGVVFFQQ